MSDGDLHWETDDEIYEVEGLALYRFEEGQLAIAFPQHLGVPASIEGSDVPATAVVLSAECVKTTLLRFADFGWIRIEEAEA